MMSFVHRLAITSSDEDLRMPPNSPIPCGARHTQALSTSPSVRCQHPGRRMVIPGKWIFLLTKELVTVSDGRVLSLEFSCICFLSIRAEPLMACLLVTWRQ